VYSPGGFRKAACGFRRAIGSSLAALEKQLTLMQMVKFIYDFVNFEQVQQKWHEVEFFFSFKFSYTAQIVLELWFVTGFIKTK
jgi:hypothetical protein